MESLQKGRTLHTAPVETPRVTQNFITGEGSPTSRVSANNEEARPNPKGSQASDHCGISVSIRASSKEWKKNKKKYCKYYNLECKYVVRTGKIHIT